MLQSESKGEGHERYELALFTETLMQGGGQTDRKPRRYLPGMYKYPDGTSILMERQALCMTFA
jgi:hypothetical protein